MSLDYELTNALVLPNSNITNDIIPENGMFFTLEEISLMFSGPAVPLITKDKMLFYTPSGLINGDAYNEAMSKYCGWVIHGPVLIISQKFLPPFFMVQGLLRYNDGTPLDSEFVDDVPVYGDGFEDEADEYGVGLNNAHKEYTMPDSELDHYNNMLNSIKPLFGNVWSLTDTDIIVSNIFGSFTEIKKPMEYIFHNFVFWCDDVENQEFFISSKMKQLAFCECLYSYKIKEGIDGNIENKELNLSSTNFQFNQCDMIAEYIGFLKEKIKNRYKLDEL